MCNGAEPNGIELGRLGCARQISANKNLRHQGKCNTPESFLHRTLKNRKSVLAGAEVVNKATRRKLDKMIGNLGGQAHFAYGVLARVPKKSLICDAGFTKEPDAGTQAAQNRTEQNRCLCVLCMF